MNNAQNSWVTCPRPNPQATMRLFCFTYAGGGTAYFAQWAASLPLTIELCPIRLPGRESRLRERPLTSIETIIPPLIEALQPLLNQKPFAFYGHSMGGIVAFETIRKLRRLTLPQPKALFVTGCRAPLVQDPDPPIHHLPEKEFLTAVGKLNGTPAAVMENKELVALLLPLLRADFEAIETYQYNAEAPLEIPIVVMGGNNDPKATEIDMAAWQEQTAAAFTHHTLQGDHFFIQNQPFLPLLSRLLSQI